MSIPNAGTAKRRLTHPGEMLREDFLHDYGLSVSGLAEAVGVSRQSIDELLRERRAISPEMALDTAYQGAADACVKVSRPLHPQGPRHLAVPLSLVVMPPYERRNLPSLDNLVCNFSASFFCCCL